MKTFVTALSLILLGALAYYFKPVSIPSGMVLDEIESLNLAYTPT